MGGTTYGCFMFGPLSLSLRIFDDLRVELAPAGRLTPDQETAIGEHLIRQAARRKVAARMVEQNEPRPRRTPRVAA